jgi:membrane-bound inhibitor of C-type lysozyme
MPRFAKLFALASTAAILPLAGPALATEARYTCSDGSKLTANFSPPDTAKGSVALTFGSGRELKLPQVLSADGGRYADADADADIEFWIKGRSATLTMKGVKETCSTQ